MPIRPENKGRYPKDWKAISLSIRDRAGQKCEQCAAVNGEVIARGQGSDAGTYMRPHGEVHDADTGQLLGYARGSEYDGSMVKVVLTVAHLDHTPENCDPSNLRAWCQRCHNRYDLEHRRKGIRERARAAKAHGDLFSCTDVTPIALERVAA